MKKSNGARSRLEPVEAPKDEEQFYAEPPRVEGKHRFMAGTCVDCGHPLDKVCSANLEIRDVSGVCGGGFCTYDGDTDTGVLCRKHEAMERDEINKASEPVEAVSTTPKLGTCYKSSVLHVDCEHKSWTPFEPKVSTPLPQPDVCRYCEKSECDGYCPALPQQEEPATQKYLAPRDSDRVWLLVFEDADRGNATYHSEAEGREAYKRASVNWNCTLFSPTPIAPLLEQEETKLPEFQGSTETLFEAIQRHRLFITQERSRLTQALTSLAAAQKEAEDWKGCYREQITLKESWRDRLELAESKLSEAQKELAELGKNCFELAQACHKYQDKLWTGAKKGYSQ